MRREILLLIAHYMRHGFDVTVCASTVVGRDLAKRTLADGLMAATELDSYGSTWVKSNKAEARFYMIDKPYGSSCLHTHVLVMLDIEKADQQCAVDAERIAVRFPDGTPPVIIFC